MMNVIRRKNVPGRISRVFIAMLAAAAFCTVVLGCTFLHVYAEEKSAPALNRYYTSIQLEQGDSLWDIAHTYAKGSGYTIREYVEELKRMNGLSGEEIHTGAYLTIVYFREQ